MEEMLDIVDENGEPTGEIIERSAAHQRGIRHRTSHVWIFRRYNDEIQVLLQKRSRDKDSYPGCFDISSAGHILAGDSFISSAIRELQEELGLTVKSEDLIYCGKRVIHYDDIFHGKRFLDNQISNIYLLWKDKKETEFKVQKSEIESVKWYNFSECIQAVENNTIKNCIHMEELLMLKKELEKELGKE